jgi:nucleotide-binding universal stress UspA family protein
MTYATVMVSLALDQSNEACLAVAGDVAERFDACVIGVAAAEFRPPLYYTSGEAAQNLIDQGYASIRKRIVELEAQFRDALQKRAKEIEWRSAREMPSTYVVKQSRTADILIANGSSSAVSDPFTGANPNDLVMQIGRPLLLVPPTVQWLDLRSAVIAWKDSREARRAIADALPMLRKAKDITVAAIVEEEANSSAVSAEVKDVVGWLSRHGIFASELVVEGNGSATTQLDRIVADVGAGIVIAGAYGHSRFREWILGGMTRHLVADSTRCSLLSR